MAKGRSTKPVAKKAAAKKPSKDGVRIGRASVSKWQLKVFLVVSGLVIVATVLLYTKNIVDEIVQNEHRTVELYTELAKRSSFAANDDLLFYIDLAYNSIYFPVILTDKDEKPIYPYRQNVLNIDIDSTMSKAAQKQYLTEYIDEMRTQYKPFELVDENGRVFNKIFYANSDLVRRLRFMPYAEIMIVSAFILIGYIAFSTIRRNEESNIWVGMSKEAAHQLGTPLSSLLAWIEIMRHGATDEELVTSTLDEMTRDVDRLNIVATRFSKIGSLPKLEPTVVADVIERVSQYFETRLPNLGRKVSIVRVLDHELVTDLNEDLFAWVIENLIKNAAEAIEHKGGEIRIEMHRRVKGGMLVTVRDNGKGMTAQVKSRIFQPGYTTKKRGWGLGLSLARRIVEEYHGGRIYVRDSAQGAGTTFAIELP